MTNSSAKASETNEKGLHATSIEEGDRKNSHKKTDVGTTTELAKKTGRQ